MSQSSKLSLTFIASIALYFAVSLVMAFLPSEIEIPIYFNLLLSQSLVLLPAAGYMKKTGRSFKKMFIGKPISGWAVLCLIIFIFAVEPLIMFLNYVSSLIFGNAAAGLSEEILYLPTWANVLFIAVLPAMFEETVFRGVFFQGYRKHGFWKAALVSALFFGLMHMNWNQFSYGFVLGILFAFLVEATGNIRASMIVHFGINFESVMTIQSLRKMMETEELQAVLEASEQGIDVGSMAGMELLYGSYLFLAAALSAAVCILLIWLMAKASHRTGYMGWMLWGGERRHLQTLKIEKFMDRYLLAAILIPAVIMTLFYFV